MKALVYKGPGKKSWEDVPNPVIKQSDRRDRENGGHHHLRHRPAHS
jgi:hypothetical protein